MVFDDNDLIQANAIIISGVLILLTLTSFSGNFVTDSSSSSLPLLDKSMIASAIIPFYCINSFTTQFAIE
jgi:hypothetical protein